jgi:hypothetical protein
MKKKDLTPAQLSQLRVQHVVCLLEGVAYLNPVVRDHPRT